MNKSVRSLTSEKLAIYLQVRLQIAQHAYYLDPSSENLGALQRQPGSRCECGTVLTGLPHVVHRGDCRHWPTMMRRDDRLP
jgi:hypothetical protein